MPDKPSILFRTDGNASIGLGHVTRCLALAAMLAPEFACRFALRNPDPAVRALVQAEGHALLEVPGFASKAAEAHWLAEQVEPGQLLVLDGYDFPPDYQQTLWNLSQGLVYLDDLLSHYQWADVVINQAGGITAADYRAVPGAALCLGPQYALLRPPFQAAAQAPAQKPDLDQIFLNMGGADPDNHTLRLVSQLRQQFPQKRLAVVTGVAYPHQAELQLATAALPEVTLYHNLGAEELAQLLSGCGIMVCPPSGMAYECCAVGGLLLLHSIADNQQRMFRFLTGNGLALPFAELPHLSEALLPATAAQVMQRQREVFDGQAADRLRKVFGQLRLTYSLDIRRAAAADALQYFLWANDADVRRNAIHPEPIAWETHVAWFSRRLADADSFLYIFERDNQPVGQVRVDFDGADGTIDYSVDLAFRGLGLGLAVLRRALGQLRRDKAGAWVLTGQVKATNLPSGRVFHLLSFAPQPPVQLHDENYDVFRLAVGPAAE